MTCVEFQNRLSAYVDGELSRWKRWKVDNHVRQCGECAMLLRELHEVDQALLTGVQETPPAPYITGSVMRRLPAMPPVWRRRGGGLPWAAGLAVAGMQVAVLCGAYYWGFAQGSTRGAPGQAAGLGTPMVTSPMGNAPARPARSRGAQGPGDRGQVLTPRTVWTSVGGGYPDPAAALAKLEDQKRGVQKAAPRRPAAAVRPVAQGAH